MFVLGICSESRYLASSLSLLGRKDEELSDAHSVSASNFRKLLGGATGASSSSLLKAKSCEIMSFSPFMRPKIVACKLVAVILFSLMSKFKHTVFSKFRYVGVEFISTLHRNTSPIFSRMFPRFSILEKIISQFAAEYLLSCAPRTRAALNFALRIGVNLSPVQSFHI